MLLAFMNELDLTTVGLSVAERELTVTLEHHDSAIGDSDDDKEFKFTPDDWSSAKAKLLELIATEIDAVAGEHSGDNKEAMILLSQ